MTRINPLLYALSMSWVELFFLSLAAPYAIGFVLLHRLRLSGHAWHLGVTAVLLLGTLAATGIVQLWEHGR